RRRCSRIRRSARRTWSAFPIRRAARMSPPSWWRSRPSPRKSFSPTAAPGSRATRSRATSGSGARTSCPRSRAARWTRPRCARRRRAWARPRPAVHVRLRGRGRAAEDVGDLLRGDVLALPAEGVADAIDEVVVAVGVLEQQIPGAEPGVAAREGVAHELPLARRAVGVAVVLHGAADASEELARLTRRARDAEAVGAAHELAARQVEAAEPDGVLEHRVGLAGRADAPV